MSQSDTYYQYLQCGAKLEIRDKDELGPLDMIMKDRLPHVQFTSTGKTASNTAKEICMKSNRPKSSILPSRLTVCYLLRRSL